MGRETKARQAERAAAADRLREFIKPGDTVYTVLRHVSSSGMSRRISVVLLQANGAQVTDLHPNYLVAEACGLRLATGNRDAIVMGGCGMDMGFALVYELSQTLFPDGYECIGKNCPSNDHSNGDRNYEPHHHDSGGYALRQRWL